MVLLLLLFPIVYLYVISLLLGLIRFNDANELLCFLHCATG